MAHLSLDTESRRESLGVDPLVVNLVHLFKVLWRYVGNVDGDGDKIFSCQTRLGQYTIQFFQCLGRLLRCAGGHLGEVTAQSLGAQYAAVDDILGHPPCLDAGSSDGWWELLVSGDM